LAVLWEFIQHTVQWWAAYSLALKADFLSGVLLIRTMISITHICSKNGNPIQLKPGGILTKK
jgi:hypothetical protein